MGTKMQSETKEKINKLLGMGYRFKFHDHSDGGVQAPAYKQIVILEDSTEVDINKTLDKYLEKAAGPYNDIRDYITKAGEYRNGV